MKEIKIRKFNLIKFIYGIFVFIFLISTILPYYSKYYAPFPPPPATPVYPAYYSRYLGYEELVY
ncbi:MAG: hypothetical protein ACXAC7_23570, partial [Candidatus Hodarchaeales archaeon]